MNATGSVQTTPHRTHTRVLFLAAHDRTPDVITRLAQGLDDLFVCLKVISSLVMSLLNVPSTPLPPFLSSPSASLTPPTASPTPPTGIRLNPCATPLWGGSSGRLADRNPNTGLDPKFCIDVSSEHTPTNLPTRNMSFQQEYDVTITASEDLNLPRQCGASSSSQHTTASRVHTLLKLGSLGTSLTKVSADCDSVASRTGIKET